MRTRRWVVVVLAAALGVGACASGPAGNTGTGPTATPAAGGTPAAAGTPGAPGGGSGASTGAVAGTITTGAPYAATWTWRPGNSAGVDGITLNSDKGTFANLTVLVTGDITFTSGATELAGSPYHGTGGTVDVKQVGGFPTVCGLTVDHDVTGSGGAIVHIKGSLAITGVIYRSDNGLVDIDCR